MDELRVRFPDLELDVLRDLLAAFGSPDIVEQIIREERERETIVVDSDDDLVPSNHSDYKEMFEAQLIDELQHIGSLEEKMQFLGTLLESYPENANVIESHMDALQKQNEEETNMVELENGIRLHFRRYNFVCDIVKVKAEWFDKIADAVALRPGLIMSKVSAFLGVVIESGKEPANWSERLLINDQNKDVKGSMLYSKEAMLFLKNVLNMKSLAELKQVLAKQKFITTIVKDMDKAGVHSTGKKMRNRVGQLVITDPLVSVDILRVFEYEQKVWKEIKEKEHEEELYKQAEATGGLCECECCFMEAPFERMAQCPDGHLICSTCLKMQIETAVQEGRCQIPCAHCGGCDYEMPVGEMERLVPAKTLERLFQSETLNALIGAEIDLVKCCKCGYGALYEGDGPMICPECKTQTCPKCEEHWHPQMTCEQMKEIDKDRLIEEQMNEAIVRKCPKCKTQFVKDEGCNKMECPRCQTWICYLCHEIIPRNVGYNHFYRGNGICPPDQCPLWVNNGDLHVVEASQARADAAHDLERI